MNISLGMRTPSQEQPGDQSHLTGRSTLSIPVPVARPVPRDQKTARPDEINLKVALAAHLVTGAVRTHLVHDRQRHGSRSLVYSPWRREASSCSRPCGAVAPFS